MNIRFQKVTSADNGIIPVRATSGSCGYDFATPVDIECLPHKVTKVQTNIKAIFPKGNVLMLFVRSSVGIKRHIMLANGTGIIDSDFANNPDNEGNITIALYNYGDEVQRFNAGERIAQGIFVKYDIVDFDEAVSTQRVGGIGSSGV